MVSWPWLDVLLTTALGDETTSELGTFSVSQHPARDVAGEDVQDHVEVVVGPLDGATKLGDVPRPNLVEGFGQQLRLAVVRMAQLVPAFSDFSVLRQNPIHGADRAVVGSLVQKRGPDGGGRFVDKPRGVQCADYLLSLGLVQGSVGPRTTLRSGRHRPPPAIQRRTSHSQSLAGFRCLSNPPRQFLGRHDQSFSLLSGGFRGIPRSSEAFLRNSSARTRCSRLYQRVAQLTSATLEVVEDPLLIMSLVVVGARIDIGESEANGVVEQHC